MYARGCGKKVVFLQSDLRCEKWKRKRMTGEKR